ncbi:hydroxyisourate hydrolase [Labrys wisconsinensis]|uniref:5-hydroxyisourate hydrolase n=1 Tax=Labrys wisconsinensis TaxID=425677 RepID=A0ABU0J4U0_9HYPH|nr:hydroxyisourate hydrolase [Labrys wisconsinensis]MDQ0469282.1 5-hydroxyisourate hydrolase [Labrys wisconsinensis]
MTGRLTTHVLDTSTGRPAAGLALTLTRVADGVVLAERTTNADGRVDGPILEGEAFRPGVYELAFHVGDYFRRGGVTLPPTPFLDVVPVRFGLSEDGHYHVPLLVSPYGYSTYRGS